MIRYWLEKRYVQYLFIFLLIALSGYYFKFHFDFGYKFDWSVIFSVNQTYGEHFGLNLLKGLKLTFKISVISSVIALCLGTFFGLGRLSSFKPLKWLSTAYVEFFRNTPLLIQLFFWYFAFPMGLPETVRNYIFDHNFEFWCAAIGLSVYTGAFMAEIVRAGLQSIPKGLLEAAYSSGLGYLQVLRKIILPIAFRNIIPPLGSEFLNNMKNSSLAMVVGVAELTWQSQQVESLTFKGFEATTAATVLYLFLSLAISVILNVINSRLRIDGSKKNIYSKIADYVFSPLAVLIKYAKRPYHIYIYREKPEISETQYSRSAIIIKAFFKGLRTFFVMMLKVLFCCFGAFILFKLLKGVLAFDFSVIRDNIKYLLIWRFPNGSENEIFMGLGGLSFSILMALISIGVSFFIGLAVGIARTSDNLIFRLPSIAYIEIIRGNPLIIVIFWVYFFIPVVTDAFFDVFWSATIALTIFTGAYLAEIVRAGIENLPRGQFEAAYSTGLSYFQTMRLIILPQALKQMIPAIVGQFIAIFKDTSLAYVIGVLELTFVAQGLNNRLMVHPFEIYTTVAVLYFSCCYLMSLYARKLERKLTPEGDISLVM
ncbi:MAG: amino acid ABC transporter permease [Desulfobacteraceae bacterium]|nr:amino acid ABC transporter permease [Desulfobacteraceae bacterium]